MPILSIATGCLSHGVKVSLGKGITHLTLFRNFDVIWSKKNFNSSLFLHFLYLVVIYRPPIIFDKNTWKNMDNVYFLTKKSYAFFFWRKVKDFYWKSQINEFTTWSDSRKIVNICAVQRWIIIYICIFGEKISLKLYSVKKTPVKCTHLIFYIAIFRGLKTTTN